MNRQFSFKRCVLLRLPLFALLSAWGVSAQAFITDSSGPGLSESASVQGKITKMWQISMPPNTQIHVPYGLQTYYLLRNSDLGSKLVWPAGESDVMPSIALGFEPGNRAVNSSHGTFLTDWNDTSGVGHWGTAMLTKGIYFSTSKGMDTQIFWIPPNEAKPIAVCEQSSGVKPKGALADGLVIVDHDSAAGWQFASFFSAATRKTTIILKHGMAGVGERMGDLGLSARSLNGRYGVITQSEGENYWLVDGKSGICTLVESPKSEGNLWIKGVLDDGSIVLEEEAKASSSARFKNALVVGKAKTVRYPGGVMQVWGSDVATMTSGFDGVEYRLNGKLLLTDPANRAGFENLGKWLALEHRDGNNVRIYVNGGWVETGERISENGKYFHDDRAAFQLSGNVAHRFLRAEDRTVVTAPWKSTTPDSSGTFETIFDIDDKVSARVVSNLVTQSYRFLLNDTEILQGSRDIAVVSATFVGQKVLRLLLMERDPDGAANSGTYHCFECTL